MLRSSYLSTKTDPDVKLLVTKRLHLSLLFAFTLHNFYNGYDVRTIPAVNNFAHGIQLEFDEF